MLTGKRRRTSLRKNVGAPWVTERAIRRCAPTRRGLRPGSADRDRAAVLRSTRVAEDAPPRPPDETAPSLEESLRLSIDLFGRHESDRAGIYLADAALGFILPKDIDFGGRKRIEAFQELVCELGPICRLQGKCFLFEEFQIHRPSIPMRKG